MDKWNIVQIAQRYMQLLYDNWDRLTDGSEFDKGVAKVAGKRTEGLVVGGRVQDRAGGRQDRRGQC